MSNYINVLRRLERERRMPATAPAAPPAVEAVPVTPPPADADAAPRDVPAVRVAAPAPVPPPAPVTAAPPPPAAVIPLPTAPAAPPEVIATPPTLTPVSTPSARFERARSRALASAAHPGIAKLLDTIRTLSTTRAVRAVVFTGASSVEAVDALVTDLARHADANGMNALVATLSNTGGRTSIVPAFGFAANTAALDVDLDSKVPIGDLDDWIARHAPRAELLAITAPPLASSIDGALLACGCDGLVIVAESERTERAALHTAAERARIAGCRTLGVVMHGSKNRIPSWIRKLVGDTTDPHSARED